LQTRPLQIEGAFFFTLNHDAQQLEANQRHE
jgi:hypothetical protein